MPSLAAEEPKLGTDVALAARVEGWVQYCEYFHLLDADMQVQAGPQTRGAPRRPALRTRPAGGPRC